MTTSSVNNTASNNGIDLFKGKILLAAHKTGISEDNPALVSDLIGSADQTTKKATTITQEALSTVGSVFDQMISPTGMLINGGVMGGIFARLGGEMTLSGLIQLCCVQMVPRGGNMLAAVLSPILLPAFSTPFNALLVVAGGGMFYLARKIHDLVRDRLQEKPTGVALTIKEIKEAANQIDIPADHPQLVALIRAIEDKDNEAIVAGFEMMDVDNADTKEEENVPPVETETSSPLVEEPKEDKDL